MTLETSVESRAETHDLWLGDNAVLSVALGTKGGFSPAPEHIERISKTIQGLARALKAVVFHAEHAPAESGSADFLMQPVEDIAGAIMVLSQLSEAVDRELRNK